MDGKYFFLYNTHNTSCYKSYGGIRMLAVNSFAGDKYKVLRRLNQSGAASVWLAEEKSGRALMLVKEARKTFGLGPVRQRPVAEPLILTELSHPHLPNIIDVFETEDSWQIVMDYVAVAGTSLDLMMKKSGLPREKVIVWAEQICTVLHYLHSCTPSIVHGGIEPANVMIRLDDSIMLAGFGMIREVDNVAGMVHMSASGYASPEQYEENGQTDARSDIYALGATLYTLTTGQKPDGAVPFPSRAGGLERIMQKCMQPDPKDRYQSCNELLQALEHCDDADGSEPYQHLVSLPPDPRPRNLKNRMMTAQQKTQRKRVGIVIASVILISAILSGVGITMFLQNTLAYEKILARASDPQITREERIDLYMQAVAYNPSDTQPWLDMIELALFDDDFGLRKIIARLKAGIETRDFPGHPSAVVFPLDELRDSNRDGYEDICYQIGLGFWYHRNPYSENYSPAVEWFSQAETNQVAQAYVGLGECQLLIWNLIGTGRFDERIKAYDTLWNRLFVLKEATASADDDTLIMVWREIVSTVLNSHEYFLDYTSRITSDEITGFMDIIATEASHMLETQGTDQQTDDAIREILRDVQVIKNRIGQG